jgi:hypothetical protein
LGRKKILERPWISGPLCHELFDVPYRGTLAVHLITNSSPQRGLIFLEEHEISSWKYMIALLDDPKSFKINDDNVSLEDSGQISALLLGQASEQDLIDGRKHLTAIRRKLATNEKLDKESRDKLAGELKSFAGAAVDVEDEPVTDIVALDVETREYIQDYLRLCVFLVRKSEAMDRMYEEPQFTLPGMISLEHVSA